MPRLSNPQIQRVRERLYQAVESGWAEALDALGELIGADSAITFQPTFQTGQGFGSGWVALNLPDPRIANDHMVATGSIDIWTEATIAGGMYRPGAVLRGQDLVADADWERHSWRDAVYRPSQIRHWAGCLGSAPDPSQGNITYSFFRSPRRRPFSRRELNVLRQIYPDLDRAGRLAYRLRRAEAETPLAERALGALLDPVILVDPAGRLLFANAAAERRLGQPSFPLAIQANRLVASQERAQLAAALAAAGSGRGWDLALTDSYGARHDVTVAAMHRRLPMAALVLVRGPAAVAGRKHRLITSYGLTPAEAEVALLLAQGSSAVEVAVLRDVSVRTVQSQCESIARKLDLRRQTDIVRLVAGTLWEDER